MKKIILISLMFSFLIGLVSAVGPSPPHAFYGNVEYSNGTIIQEGEIIAKINGIETGRSDINNGFYDLVVESENENEMIYFYISGKSELIAEHSFEKFEITELDLVIEVEGSGDDGGNGNSGGGSSGGGGGGSSSGSSHTLKEPATSEDDKKDEGLQEPYSEILKPLGKSADEKKPGITGAVIGGLGKAGVGIIIFLAVIVVLIVIVNIARKRF